MFLPGCHLRCPYCHNPGFVDAHRLEEPLNGNLTILDHFLTQRSRLLGGIVFSGGEALLHPLLPELMEMAARHNLPVKLDTAGLLPDKLAWFMERYSLSYAAVDLKTAPQRYGELGWKLSGREAQNRLLRTLTLLKNSGIDFEVRTTVVPGLVEKRDLELMAELAELAPRWVWQPYLPGDTLNPLWSNLKAPSEEQLRSLAGEIPSQTVITFR